MTTSYPLDYWMWFWDLRLCLAMFWETILLLFSRSQHNSVLFSSFTDLLLLFFYRTKFLSTTSTEMVKWRNSKQFNKHQQSTAKTFILSNQWKSVSVILKKNNKNSTIVNQTKLLYPKGKVTWCLFSKLWNDDVAIEILRV